MGSQVYRKIPVEIPLGFNIPVGSHRDLVSRWDPVGIPVLFSLGQEIRIRLLSSANYAQVLCNHWLSPTSDLVVVLGGWGGGGGITGQMSHFLIFTCPHNAGEIRRNIYTKANMAVQCKTYQIAEETNLPSRQCKVIGGTADEESKVPAVFRWQLVTNDWCITYHNRF